MMQRLLDFDLRLTARLRLAEKPGPLRRLAVVLAHSADSWFWIAGLLLVWWLGSPFWQTRARVMLVSVLIGAVLVLLIKFTVRRKRPEGVWGGIYRKSDPHSFPSGHAARSMLLAVLAVWLGPSWFGILLLVWAPLVSAARVSMGVHYLSDVVAGMGLGTVLGLALVVFFPFSM